jgi:hypothetical protein
MSGASELRPFRGAILAAVRAPTVRRGGRMPGEEWSTDGRHAVITVPPASVAGEMEVFVTPDGWPWPNAGSRTFAYDPPGPTTTSTTTTTTTTTVPPPPSS